MKQGEKTLSLRAKTIIAVSAFLLAFLAIILVATFLDYQVSQLLTKGTLKPGQYHAEGFFGVVLESVGCLPLYLMIAFALAVLFWSSLKLLRCKNKPLSIVISVVCAIGIAVACWYAIKDTVGYVFEHAIARAGYAPLEALDKFEHSATVYAIEAVFGVIIAALALLATMHFKADDLKKLLKFLLTAAVAILVANVLIMIIKDPVGRMRFRAINAEGERFKDMVGYTPWYVSNGQPAQGILNYFKDNYGVTDAFKSFPSGHTCSAGAAYALLLVPDLFELKNKKASTVLCWAVPIVYVALVAVSRIMVGAHYLSDVTFGGTLAFVTMMISREIFICKGSHFFAVFGKKSVVAKTSDGSEAAVDAVSDEQTTAPAEEPLESEGACATPETDGLTQDDKTIDSANDEQN